jgi:hypothetical protein
MAITIGRNGLGGAPAMAQTAGAFIAILDWFLVTTLGWTKASLGTNQASYRAPTGNRFYLQVDDTSTTVARVSGWETLTALNTGTNQFPSSAQVSGGLYIAKGAATPWRAVSNGAIFYFFSKYSSSYYSAMAFGDIISFKTGDAYGTVMIGDTIGAPTAGANLMITNNNVPANGWYMPRSYTQSGTSLQVGSVSDYARTLGVSKTGNSGNSFPNKIDGCLHLAPVWPYENGVMSMRGLLPGLWNPCHLRPLSDWNTFSISSGLLSGRSFEVVDDASGGNTQIFFETSDTWGAPT